MTAKQSMDSRMLLEKETNKTLATCSSVDNFSAHEGNGTLSQATFYIVQAIVLVILSSQLLKICKLVWLEEELISRSNMICPP